MRNETYVCTSTVVTLLGSRGHGGITHMVGMLRWRHTGALGRTGWEEKDSPVHEFQPGGAVFIRAWEEEPLKEKWKGPYTIFLAHYMVVKGSLLLPGAAPALWESPGRAVPRALGRTAPGGVPAGQHRDAGRRSTAPPCPTSPAGGTPTPVQGQAVLGR